MPQPNKFHSRSEEEVLKSPLISLDARFVPESLNVEDRTVESVLTTERKVLNTPWFDEPYYEILSTDPKHIRTERIEKGIPVLDGHDRSGSVLKQLGKAQGLIQGDELKTTLRFSRKPDAVIVFQDIADGIVDKTSIGYRVYKYEDISEDDDKIKTFKAIDWEIFEISCVPIPADIDAQIRSHETIIPKKKIEENNKSERTEGDIMTEEEKKALELAQKKQTDEANKKLVDTERSRASEISKSAETAGLPASFSQDLISRGVSLEESRGLIIAEMAKKSAGTIKTPNVEILNDEKDHVRAGMSEALLHRAGAAGTKLSDNGRRFRSMNLMDMARHFAKGGFDLSRDEIIARAFHSTSDFPLILLDATNKSLQFEYEAAPQTFEDIVRRIPMADFKQKHTIKTGSFPKLTKVGENGEVKAGSMSEGKESFKLDSYASKILINRQTIINDDMDVFGKLPRLAAQAAKDLESDLIYALITSNPTMADGAKLFSAAHKNVVAGPGIDVTNVAAAWALMKKQKGLNGKALNIAASYLLTPVALEGLAMQFLAEKMIPTKVSDVNVYASKLKGSIADSRLDDASETKWYLTAQKGQADMIELGTLDGDGPKTNMKELFASGIEFEILHDVGAGLIDHVGFVGVGTFA